MAETFVKEGVEVSWDNTYAKGYGSEYGWWENFGNYEPHTYRIVKEHAHPDLTFVDIGVHIGSVSIFAAAGYRRVVGFEADHCAFLEAMSNVGKNVETRGRIYLHNVAIGDAFDVAMFGGHGPAGNGESTLLVREDGFEERCSLPGRSAEERLGVVESVPQLSTQEIFAFVPEFRAKTVGLVKMDIEGGEKYVVPTWAPFIASSGAALLLSIHFVFLSEEDIDTVLGHVYGAFSSVRNAVTGAAVSRADVLSLRVHDLLCSGCAVVA